MEIAADLVPGWLQSAAIVLLAALLLPAVNRVGRLRTLPSPHLAGAVSVAVGLLWAAKVTPMPGFTVHLTGAPLAALLLGVPLGLLAVSAGALLAVGFGAMPWEMAALQALVHGALPVLVLRACLVGSERWFGTHLFVYLLGVAFFGSSVSVIVATSVSTLLGAALGLPVPDDAWIALVPIAYAEAFLTGALTTVMVVYRPRWVATFDDARYLRRR